jgi:hypothetical protein
LIHLVVGGRSLRSLICSYAPSVRRRNAEKVAKNGRCSKRERENLFTIMSAGENIWFRAKDGLFHMAGIVRDEPIL